MKDLRKNVCVFLFTVPVTKYGIYYQGEDIWAVLTTSRDCSRVETWFKECIRPTEVLTKRRTRTRVIVCVLSFYVKR